MHKAAGVTQTDIPMQVPYWFITVSVTKQLMSHFMHTFMKSCTKFPLPHDSIITSVTFLYFKKKYSNGCLCTP